MSETPVERSLHAQQASLTYWSQVDDRAAATQTARDGLTRKWEREIDPDGELAPQELARRVEMRRRAHMAGMTRNSLKARRLKAEAAAKAAENAAEELEASTNSTYTSTQEGWICQPQ